MANIDPIKTAGEFIETLKALHDGVVRFAASGEIRHRTFKGEVDAIALRMALAEQKLAALQDNFTNEQIATRLSERLASPPADLIAAYVGARTAVSDFIAWYVANVQSTVSVESVFSEVENRHLEATVNVSTAGALQTQLGNITTALAPFAD
jgi:hypothetical protein